MGIDFLNILADSNWEGHYPWIESGEIQDYILLDFRTSIAFSPNLINTNQLDDPFLYLIVSSEDYTSYEIYDLNVKLVVEKAFLLDGLN